MIWDFPYDSTSAITQLLEKNNLALTKKFGQNFLINLNTLDKIASSIVPLEGKSVWEIGPGIGQLTKQLLLKGSYVTSFEIDRGFCKILREQAFKDVENFTLVEGDALKTLFEQKEKPDYIFGNLPYNVGSVIIATLIEKGILVDQQVYTLQKEVALRMEAKENTKLYNFLTILVQNDYIVEKLFDIKGGSFFPPPNVTSVTIKLTKRDKPLVEPHLKDDFLLLVKELFANRRKTIRNNFLLGSLKTRFDETLFLNALNEVNLKESLRAETIPIEKFIQLAKLLFPSL